MTAQSVNDDIKEPTLTKRQKVGIVLGLVAFAIPVVVDVPGLDRQGEFMLGIFLLAVVFWVTEAIPLFATAAVIILLQVFLTSTTAIVEVSDDAPTAASIFASLSNPVIILFMGGFLIAHGAAKYHLDRNIAAVFMRPFAGSIRLLILGILLVTAILSMFMSNTATAAAMFALVAPILKSLPKGRARWALGLAIPAGANIGGMGTPVGTPPNAIALAALNDQGVSVTFVQWMALAAPFWILLLAVAWLFLVRGIPSGQGVEIESSTGFETSWRAIVFYIVTLLTIVLWMTEPLHGVSANAVGFVPVALFFAFRVLSGTDLQRLDWPVLWLVAGGIALGNGMSNSGLDVWLIDLIDWSSLPSIAVLVLLVVVTLLMSTLISNSATANLLVPLSITFAALAGENVLTVAAMIALAASLAMAMPISTPPNAIAYATGHVSLRAMATLGAVIGSIGAVILALVMPWLWHLMGVA